MSLKEKVRKVRSDKKRDVQPTISTNLKNCIYRLNYITDVPVKDVVEILCEKGLSSRNVISHLSRNFKRDFRFQSTIYIGKEENESLRKDTSKDKKERISTRFSKENYDKIHELANALDVTPSRATAIILDASVKNTNILNAFVKNYLHQNIDNNRMKELKSVIHFINNNNPYREEVSWFNFISFIIDDLKEGTVNLKGNLIKWLEKYK
jgi:hypothetical protein